MGKNAAISDLLSERILLLSGSEGESEATRAPIAKSGYSVEICQSPEGLLSEISRGVGAIILSHGVLMDRNLARFCEALKLQPPWSHIPIVVLLGDLEPEEEVSFPLLESIGNVTLLEGAVRQSTLVTTVRAAIAYRRRQYQMRDLLDQLESSHEEAVEANRAKSDFLANMSHEIRTPLGAVLGFAELLMESGVSDREKQVYMTAVKRNGQMLSALIDDILDLSKVESGRVEIERIEFSLSELLAEIVSALEPKASKKGLQLTFSKSPQTPEVIKADPIRMKQVLMNIIGNAIKFTSHGSVHARVDLSASEKSSALLEFEIEDTGVGISSRQVERLFKPFTQADSSTTRRFGGTGLGLVLSQKLTRAMGGDLILKWSIPGGGSCFHISVAVELPSQIRVSDREPLRSVQQPKALPLVGARVLVVDDSLDNQMLISRILRLLGSEVELAGDGQEGIEKALAGDYDVVLMDLQMPRLGGVEATRQLRERGYTRPIVALTAHALKEDRLRCMSVGCTDYLTKPIQRAHLVQVLERVARDGSVLQH